MKKYCITLIHSRTVFILIQGADFKNNQTTKQVNNSIWTNRKQANENIFLEIDPCGVYKVVLSAQLHNGGNITREFNKKTNNLFCPIK